MQFESHEFEKNFMNAVGSKDKGLTKRMMLDELSTLIVRYPLEVGDAIRDSGIELKEKPSSKTLIDVLSNNLEKNKKLAKKIVVLMAKKSTANSAVDGKYHNAPGKVGSFLKNNPDLVNTGANLLSGLFSKRRGTTTAGTPAPPPKKEATKVITRNVYIKQGKKPGMSGLAIGGLVAGAVLLVGGIITAVVLISRAKKGKE